MNDFSFTETLLVASFVFLIVGAMWNGVATAWKMRDNSDDWLLKLPSRTSNQFVDGLFSGQWLLVALSGYYVVVAQPDPRDFGFQPLGYYWPLAFIAGCLSYAIFVAIFEWIIRRLGASDEMTAAAYIGARSIWPRDKDKVWRLRVALALNPFTEELLYRGFLVYFLGNLFDARLSFVALGLIACLAAHAYQGTRILWFHAGFYCLNIVLLFSPFGIVAAFGAHLIGDFYPLTLIRRQRDTYRAMRRKRRALQKPRSEDTA
ncbi:MAG: CPBP family glutamic-type intramembrane protease [Pseudomonadota bacterium]